jgi:hypothetical protein
MSRNSKNVASLEVFLNLVFPSTRPYLGYFPRILEVTLDNTCFLCRKEIGNTILVFKNSDLKINHLVPPPQMKEDDVMCVHCFNQMLRSRQTNINKNRIDTLVEILQKEMLNNEINIDSILEKLDKEMDQWSLSEPVKTFYLVEVMDIIEVAAQYQTSKLETVNQIRNLLSLDFDKKTQFRDE